MSAEKVVIGWDGTEQSVRALDWAAQRATLHQQSVLTVTATSDFAFDYASAIKKDEETRNELAATSAELRRTYPQLGVGTQELEGAPVRVLRDLSAEASLLVVGAARKLGTHRHSAWSVGAGIVAASYCPVAVIPEDVGTATGGVVVGVDGTKLSLKAAQFAAGEAARTGSTLRIVHVWHEPALWLDVLPWTGESLGQMRAEHQSLLDEVVSEVHSAFSALDVQGILRKGATARELALMEPQPSLLVIGSHAHSRGALTLLGSITLELLINQVCPIIIVPSTVAPLHAVGVAPASARQGGSS